MDGSLCDELLQEIFHRLPPPSSSAVSLVSKRWLRLLRSSLTSLSLRFPSHQIIPSLSPFLSHHPFLTSLSITTVPGCDADEAFSDQLLLSVSSSCPNLKHLRFLTGPASLFPLLSISTSCTYLLSLTIILSRPLSFYFLTYFSSLKNLSLICTGGVSGESDYSSEPNSPENLSAQLQIETLCLTGIRAGDYGLSWLWRSCKTLKKLQFRSCEGVGDNSSFGYFLKTAKNLLEVELRTSRPIVDGVLLKLAENCSTLNSLLLYDGGSKEGLLHFIRQTQCNLQKLDLRLPLDLDNHHLSAIARNCRGLSSLRLQSSCLITGEGLKTLGLALNNNLEELALINCDVINRETGLLTTLGQNLQNLKKLDLSHNDMLQDKEFVSMMVSCSGLSELKLRGCSRLTDASLASLLKNCKHLENIDLIRCCGIKAEAVEFMVMNFSRLRTLQVEENKLSDIARRLTANKFIKVTCI